jgi:hypothetical protein
LFNFKVVVLSALLVKCTPNWIVEIESLWPEVLDEYDLAIALSEPGGSGAMGSVAELPLG